MVNKVILMNDNINVAFDILLDGLDTILIDLFQRSEQLNNKDIFSQANKFTTEIDSIREIQAKLLALREEWSQINLSTPSEELKQISISDQKPTYPLKPGLRTPNRAFQLPLLVALIQLGGSGTVQAILDRVHQMMKDQLNEFDYQSLPSDPKSVRWENTVRWARNRLVEEGHLASNSPHGIWEITEAGRKHVQNISPDMDSGMGETESEYYAEQFDFKDEEAY